MDHKMNRLYTLEKNSRVQNPFRTSTVFDTSSGLPNQTQRPYGSNFCNSVSFDRSARLDNAQGFQPGKTTYSPMGKYESN